MSEENQFTLKPGPGKAYRWKKESLPDGEHRKPNYHKARKGTQFSSQITTKGYVVNWLRIIEYYRGEDLVAKIQQLDRRTWEAHVRGMKPKRFTDRKECKTYVWDLIE